MASVKPLLPALLLALAFMPGAAIAQPVPAAQAARPIHVIPFELYDNRIYVEVAGPGFERSPFIVDTGAQATHYTSELAARAGLRTSGRVGISGTGAGRVRGTYVAPLSLRIGSLTLPVRRGIAAPGETLFGDVFRGSGRSFKGVIGYDLFAAYSVEIDYAGRALRLYPAGSAASTGAGVTPLRLVDRKPYLAAVLTVDGAPIAATLHLDTGFSGALGLNAAFVAEQNLLIRVGALLPAWNRGVGGITEARLARIAAVRLGGQLIERPITGLALVQGAGVRRDSAGRIGGDLLRRFRVVIDYASGTLALTANAALSEPFEADMSGLSLVAENGAYLIGHVAPATPAAEAGLREGDRLLAVDERPASAMTLETVRDLLRRDGERRRLRLLREGREVEASLLLRRRL